MNKSKPRDWDFADDGIPNRILDPIERRVDTFKGPDDPIFAQIFPWRPGSSGLVSAGCPDLARSMSWGELVHQEFREAFLPAAWADPFPEDDAKHLTDPRPPEEVWPWGVVVAHSGMHPGFFASPW